MCRPRSVQQRDGAAPPASHEPAAAGHEVGAANRAEVVRGHPPTCQHSPVCPVASAVDHEAARTVRRHPEQGWVLLCNGVVVFDDTGELLPDGRGIAPHRPSYRRAA